MTNLSLRAKSNKTDGNEASYEGFTVQTRKTRLLNWTVFHLLTFKFMTDSLAHSAHFYVYQVKIMPTLLFLLTFIVRFHLE